MNGNKKMTGTYKYWLNGDWLNCLGAKGQGLPLSEPNAIWKKMLAQDDKNILKIFY